MKNKTLDELLHTQGLEIPEGVANTLPQNKVNDIIDNMLGRNKVTRLKVQIKKLTDDERKELLVFLWNYIYMKGDTWDLKDKTKNPMK